VTFPDIPEPSRSPAAEAKGETGLGALDFFCGGGGHKFHMFSG
jgi:hypothetical protein